jgi:hypothetical protein
MEERREALAQALAEVRIDKAKHRGGNKFDTGRVGLTYRWDLFLRAADRFEETATDEQRAQGEAAYRQMGAGS